MREYMCACDTPAVYPAHPEQAAQFRLGSILGNTVSTRTTITTFRYHWYLITGLVGLWVKLTAPVRKALLLGRK